MTFYGLLPLLFSCCSDIIYKILVLVKSLNIQAITHPKTKCYYASDATSSRQFCYRLSPLSSQLYTQLAAKTP